MADAPAVTFVTSAGFPDAAGERAPVTAALRRHGIGCRWEVWDDPSVDWSATPFVVIRTTWDYSPRLDDFLAWGRRVESVSRLVNPTSILDWNTHKGYLVALAREGIPCVPTVVGRPGAPVDGVVADAERVVVKPAVGAGGRGLTVRPADDPWDGSAVDVDHVVQPFMSSVRTEGERSVFVIEGRPVAAVAKRPADGEIRVHEEYGGQFTAIPMPDELIGVAAETVATAARLVGVEPAYGRVDFLRDDTNRWLVSELELVEPGLYPTVVPDVVEAYAAMVAGLLSRSVG